ncbi:hypothetical protein HOA55_01245 [archaeon]|nr:hypothetical protein [archaeon]MBT3578068.1 hypothetical protein [archaeon]MBT6819959.1 hypothetical protein [archaeon]MBT6956306.1 hypothetical protein [archaeon]MBT7024996.1 hypothetical protein [archaeon]
MKKLFGFLILMLFAFSVVSAIEISEEHKGNVLIRDMESSVDFTLNVGGAESGFYNVYTLSDVVIAPADTFIVSEPDFERNFTILPTENLNIEGYYTFTYTLNHRDVEKYDKKFTVKVMNLADAIEIGSDSIDPTSGKVKFYIQNKENFSLENISGKFSSVLFDVEETFDLSPMGTTWIDVDVDEEKLKITKAGTYIIDGEIETLGGTKVANGKLYLGEKKGITTKETKAGFLIRSNTISKINVGNVAETVEIEDRKNIFSRLFSTFSIEPTSVERKGFVVDYSWTGRIDPTEDFTVEIRTNYIFPFLIIILAGLIIVGFKRYTESRIEVTKSVSHIKTKNREFALKVKVSVRAKKGVENLSLIDKIPGMVKVYKKFGIIKPDKFDVDNRRLQWNLGDLRAGEERILTYIIYSRVGVMGKFSLPAALAVFEKEGKLHEVDSNTVFFLSDQVKTA